MILLNYQYSAVLMKVIFLYMIYWFVFFFHTRYNCIKPLEIEELHLKKLKLQSRVDVFLTLTVS